MIWHANKLISHKISINETNRYYLKIQPQVCLIYFLNGNPSGCLCSQMDYPLSVNVEHYINDRWFSIVQFVLKLRLNTLNSSWIWNYFSHWYIVLLFGNKIGFEFKMWSIAINMTKKTIRRIVAAKLPPTKEYCNF